MKEEIEAKSDAFSTDEENPFDYTRFKKIPHIDYKSRGLVCPPVGMDRSLLARSKEQFKLWGLEFPLINHKDYFDEGPLTVYG